MRFQIEGMSCGGCVKSVQRILVKQTGLTEAQVHVSLEDSSATVDAELTETTVETAAKALQKAGFELKR